MRRAAARRSARHAVSRGSHGEWTTGRLRGVRRADAQHCARHRLKAGREYNSRSGNSRSGKNEGRASRATGAACTDDACAGCDTRTWQSWQEQGGNPYPQRTFDVRGNVVDNSLREAGWASVSVAGYAAYLTEPCDSASGMCGFMMTDRRIGWK